VIAGLLRGDPAKTRLTRVSFVALCFQFKQDLSSWDVSKVRTMHETFGTWCG